MPPYIDRRRFLGTLLTSAAIIGCKKSNVISPKKTQGPTVPPVTDSYLAQYSATEVSPVVGAPGGVLNTFNGYVDAQSYLPGSQVSLFLSGTPKTSVDIILRDIQGNTVLTVPTPLARQTINTEKPWVDGLNFSKTFSVNIPPYLKSGIYTWSNFAPMIVKGSASSYDLTVVYNSNTQNAYNACGGKSLYFPSFNDRATVVSYLRSNTLINGPFFKFLDNLNYNINYIADSDLDDYSQLDKSKVVIITGHSEYWTRKARENIDQFIASGRNVIMLSGNSMWWQVRYDKPKNLMICYKSTSGSSTDITNLDPLNNTIYNTVNWGNSSSGYPIAQSIGAEYRFGGYGNTLTSCWNGYKIVNANSPLFSGTGLQNGDILNVPTREYDGAPMEVYYPPGSNIIPTINNSTLQFYKIELLGFDYAQNLTTENKLGYGTFIICQKTPTSGVVINAASNDWCSNIGTGQKDDDKLQIITRNMIKGSLLNTNFFTT